MRARPIEEAEGLDTVAGAAAENAVDELIGDGDTELV